MLDNLQYVCGLLEALPPLALHSGQLLPHDRLFALPLALLLLHQRPQHETGKGLRGVFRDYFALVVFLLFAGLPMFPIGVAVIEIGKSAVLVFDLVLQL